MTNPKPCWLFYAGYLYPTYNNVHSAIMNYYGYDPVIRTWVRRLLNNIIPPVVYIILPYDWHSLDFIMRYSPCFRIVN